MGWTDRQEIKNDYLDIIEYLELMDGFHDYRIGNLHYDGNTVDIFVEEVIPGAKIQYSTGLIWDFHFIGVRSFYISVDCAGGFWIYEIERGNELGEISFNLVPGHICVTAEKVTLGIPSHKKP